MGRYTGPSCKLCRREGVPLMLKGQRCLTDKCAVKKKKYPPGPPRKRRSKLSEYGIQLREKQKIKKSYGLLEKQFKLIFEEASRMKGVTGHNMLSLLERRLDNVVYRMGFATSRKQARQFVQHRHVLVNDRIVDIPSFVVREGFEVRIGDSFKESAMLTDAVKLSKAISSVPEWINADFENKSGKVVRLPNRQDVTANINEQLVVELYSK
ncbi:MAG TPA: 30S ribosomal protein S4 [Spirochaetota bacterium]|nr:30S ribosomal protein S4 [Spirochaetota bacterium]HNT11258.1 30S ribosomal protein S4 [Spirochaetota bacterium]HOS38645.1 30S ribosomal protein S4 [Spirochaetota bacterium]HPU87513.1 30S ribosomal protein S4 [Spirochaetota bacterium]